MTLGGPLGWRNPLKVPGRSVRAPNLAVADTNVIIAGSTTDTINWAYAGTIFIHLPARALLLEASGFISVSHTVADAEVDFGAQLWSPEGNLLWTQKMRFHSLGLANRWEMVAFCFLMNLELLADNGVPVTAGRHFVDLVVGPNTAGTMSWVQPQSNDAWAVKMYGLQ